MICSSSATPRSRLWTRFGALFGAVLLLCSLAPAQQPKTPGKRPLKHTDYDSWQSIQSQTLSRDGKYLAYNLMPVEGEGHFIVRNTVSGAEHRIPRGRTVVAATGEGGAATAPTIPAGVGGRGGRGGFPGAVGGGASSAHQFTPDSKSILFPLVPTRAEIEKARADKKSPEEMPRTTLAIMDLSSGKITTRIDGATTFLVAGEGAGLLIYRKAPRPETRPAGTSEATEKPGEKSAGAGRSARPRTEEKPGEKPGKPPIAGMGTGGPGTAGTPITPQRTFGSDLILRSLADSSERVLNDVVDYSLTRDGKLLVYTVSSRNEETNGVYVLTPPSGTPAPILSGKGRYQRVTWDEKQTQLVFASDKEDAASAQPKFKIYHWTRTQPTRPVADASRVPPMGSTALATAATLAAQAAPSVAPATDLLGPNPPGLRAGWAMSDRGTHSFSSDGSRLYVNTGPARAPDPEKPAAATGTPTKPTGPTGGGRGRFGGAAPGGSTAGATPPDENKVNLDLWHWKDEQIQPMQKLRAGGEQNKTYRAVYFLKEKQFRQLSDETLEVNPAAEGDWAIGEDDRSYRYMTGYGPSLRDLSLVNTRSGEKRPLLQASPYPISFSPRGRWLLSFDGKDWNSISIPDGKKTNLTARLPVKFFREDWDTPSEAPPHGVTGWTVDEKHVLLNDRFDIWKVAIDGSEASNLTGGHGRKSNIAFRLLRLPQGEEDRERGLDLSKPVLLKADNERTRDEGFFRLDPGNNEPKMLLMGARRYGLPLKARNSDTLLLTVSTFYDAPDYYVTTPEFRELRRVTEANPQKKDILWGKSELVRYNSLDGVSLSGVLIKPEDFDPSKKYPMIVYIYEKLSQGLHNFVPPTAGTSINASYYASNGYLVYMPDIVYTIGSPGQSALKCVLPGIQAVVDKGCVDEKAIGIQGHSWGGYQIAYMVTQTTRFKAAIAGAPVSNMISAYDGIRWGTGLPRQFQYERTQSRIGGTLWQYPTRFIENSPILMADRVQTPLMMLHNDEDDAVPWYQGIEYFLALRRLGKECYLLNYNGERHGLARKGNRRDWSMRMQQFFDYHLKGAAKPEWMDKGVPYLERDKEKEKWKEVVGAAK